MFKIEADQVKKRFNVYAEGFFLMDEASAFVKEFTEKSKVANSKTLTLVVDTRKLSAGTPEVAENMSSVIELYINTPFKERYAYKLESRIAQSQVIRVGKGQKGFELIKFIDSESEIK